MIVYFDESYDEGHQYLILGALFNPTPKDIHAQFLTAKRSKRYVNANGIAKEIKYTLSNSHYRYAVAEKAVDCFMNSPSWFRAIVIDQRPGEGFSLDFFGRPGEPRALKEAKAYKKFTEMLLRSNIGNITNGTLLTDRLTRPKGDAFLPLITDLFGTPDNGYSSGRRGPIFRHIQEVDTAEEQYQVGQIGDILTRRYSE